LIVSILLTDNEGSKEVRIVINIENAEIEIIDPKLSLLGILSRK